MLAENSSSIHSGHFMVSCMLVLGVECRSTSAALPIIAPCKRALAHFRTLVTLRRVSVRVWVGLELRLGLVSFRIRVRVRLGLDLGLGSC